MSMSSVTVRKLLSFQRVFKAIKNRFTLIKGGYRISDNGKGNSVEFGKNIKMEDVIVSFYGNNNILKIGNDCTLRNARFDFLENGNCIMLGDGNQLGNNVKFMAGERTKISVGDDCQIAEGTHIRTYDGHSVLDENNVRINPSLDINICDKCWIGENTLVLKGAYVGENVIIAARSVVTKGNKDDNAIYAGSPAKRVKEKIHWVPERL